MESAVLAALGWFTQGVAQMDDTTFLLVENRRKI
jgi:hypothetical protein